MVGPEAYGEMCVPLLRWAVFVTVDSGLLILSLSLPSGFKGDLKQYSVNLEDMAEKEYPILSYMADVPLNLYGCVEA